MQKQEFIFLLLYLLSIFDTENVNKQNKTKTYMLMFFWLNFTQQRNTKNCKRIKQDCTENKTVVE